QDTSIVHRMLSQKAVQHEAVLATLAALSHPPAPERLFPSLQPALPQLQAVGHSDGAHWRGSAAPPAGLAGAIARARALGRPTALAAGAEGYWLVGPSGWSMRVDGRQLLAPADIPGTLGALSLDLPGGRLDLLASGAAGPGLQLQRDKPLGAASQPFALHSARRLTPGAWPWAAWLAWAAASAAMVAGWTLWRRSRAYARREREQARLAAIGRLNTLGEMAAGIAHELNQPLTAILAHAGAAQRMLDDPHEQTEVRRALQSTAAQARHAAEILGRLRTLVAHGAPVRRAPLDPDELVASLRFLRAKCIREGTAPICICAMLAAEMPMIPPDIADEVSGYFADLTAWIAAVLEEGSAKGQFQLRDSAAAEARTFMSTVHGAMLTARAFGDPAAFQAVSRAAIARLAAA